MTGLIRILMLAIAILVTPAIAGAQSPEPSQGQAVLAARYEALLDDLHPQTGKVRIGQARAVLDLGTSYYFLPADEAKRVLTEAWGNPADAVSDVRGMVFPAGKTFLDEGWGAVITYEPSGYVDDSDAKDIDYDELLTQMKDATVARNNLLAERGLETQQLVGWAQPPTYDAVRKTMIWARNIRFSGAQSNTLNYDVRLLGRHGVLSLNMVADMRDLALVRTAAATLGQSAAFETGARYADFDSSTDKRAEYGLAGLVAASAGAAAAKKLGLLGILAGLGKKLFVLIGVVFAAIIGLGRRLFGGRSEDA